MDLLGKSWDEVRRCYGLARELYKRAGIILPDFNQPDEVGIIHKAIIDGEKFLTEQGKIKKIDKPEPWCLAVIQWLNIESYNHICVILPDCKSFLHVTKKTRVVVENFRRLERWGIIRGYYKWIE